MSDEINNSFLPGLTTENTDAADQFQEAEPVKKKSAGAAILTLLVACGAGATYFMYLHAGPRSASAASAESAAATAAISQFLEGGNRNLSDLRQSLGATEARVRQFARYPLMPQTPLAQLAANPFHHVALKSAAAEDNSSARKKREEERATILQAVQGLQVQSILYGETRRACLINDTLYQEGQAVDQFTIEQISSNAVIVKTGIYRFELRMQK